MSARIVDTNVAIVANGKANQASVDCELACIDALEVLVAEGVIVIDNQDLILAEYEGHLSHAGQPGVGDMFFKFLFDNRFNEAKVELAPITPLGDDPRMFQEFPDDERLMNFDRSDRKFVAAARASAKRPYVLNAADSDWHPVADVLAEWDVRVRELCFEELKLKRDPA